MILYILKTNLTSIVIFYKAKVFSKGKSSYGSILIFAWLWEKTYVISLFDLKDT